MKTTSEKFWKKVDKGQGPDDCWLWKGSITHAGAGRFQYSANGYRKNTTAHRFSYEEAFGNIPDGFSISHKCSNKHCVNPSHLVPPNSEHIFWQKVDKGKSPNDCWEWMGTKKTSGYGNFALRGVQGASKYVLAHRHSYEQVTGKKIPPGMHIDHLCRNRSCVNPSHLEPVTPGENVRRGMNKNMVAARLGVCTKGHRVEGDNAYLYRQSNGTLGVRCKTCIRALSKRRKQKREASKAASQDPPGA